MTAIELYKFIEENNIEFHYEDNDGKEDVIIFPYIFHIDKFYQILNAGSILDDDGIECILKDGYFAIWMNDICAYNGVELSEVFDKEKEKES